MCSQNAVAVRDQNTAVASMADICSQQGMWDKICAMGKVLQNSKMLGENVTESGAIAATITMVAEGLNPVEFKRRYHIIGNTPSRTTGSLLGDFQQMGGTWNIIKSDDEVCEIEFKLGEMKYTSRVEMARMLQTTVPFGKDGQLKANWANFPDDMLFARCCAKGLNRIAPSIKGGIYTREEVMDFDQSANVQPPRAEINENEMRYRAAMAKGPKATEPAVEEPAKPEEKPEQKRKSKPSKEDAEDAVVVEPVKEEPVKEEPDAKPSDVFSCTVCPIEGTYFGIPFSNIDTDILAFMVDPACLSKHPEMTADHVACVNSIIENRFAEAEESENA